MESSDQKNIQESICLSDEDVEHFKNLAIDFSKRTISPMFEGEFADGDLSYIPGILEKAFETGIAASVKEEMAGSEYGIWGNCIEHSGFLSSIVLLSKISETCGGIAMCLHAQGVAVNILSLSKSPLPFSPDRVGLGLQEGMWPPNIESILSEGENHPLQIETTAVLKGGSYIINGTKSFIYSMDEIDGYLVFAHADDGWGCFIVPADSNGVTKNDVGVRTGLRACCLEHVTFTGTVVPLQARIDSGNARELLIRAMCLNWVGMSSIALGIARGAITSARNYTSERHQGGTMIDEHPAIKMLIAGSEAAIKSAEATVNSLSEYDTMSVEMLGKAAVLKLMVLELCAKSVTDCLQTFGGYGYMEDFGMEKRLRDITVLKSAFGSSIYLKQMVFEIQKEGTR